MELTDIAPLEKWVELEREIVRRSNLDANVFDTKGYRISQYKQWANKLCPAIKDTDRGQSFICAVAHMNLATQAKNTGKPVIEECDAGLLKMVVPIFFENEFVGAVGACGHLLEGGEVDAWMVNRTTEIETETVERLSLGIPAISAEKLDALAAFIGAELEKILSRRNDGK
jgi:ligand-binding sensor protein